MRFLVALSLSLALAYAQLNATELIAKKAKRTHHHHSHKSSSSSKPECFQHSIQLQLSDSLGFPVDGTEFWVTLDIIKKGDVVTIQFPVINFQTGPESAKAPFPPLVPGGYLYTADGFLPKNIRPNDLVYRSIVAASNNGASLPFSFAQDPSTLPVPPVGYILSITNAGAIVVQSAGTFGNIIPPGPQILMPANITYIAKPKVQLCKNIIIQPGFTNTTQFTGIPAAVQLRDSHTNDASDNVLAWSWTSNSNIADQTNGTLNVFIAVGKVTKDETLKVGDPVQLTNLAPGVLAVDTAVAINRTDPNNIVVSYSLPQSPSSPLGIIFRAVSFDGGQTWPINGPLSSAPNYNNSGDNPGVQADKFGNIWYCYGSPWLTDNPTFLASSDGGVTFQTIFVTPLPTFFNPNDYGYDYPQYCFGGDGQGNYGLWFVTDYINSIGNFFQFVGFIPITGLGQFGTGAITPALTSLTNTSSISNIAASLDGKVWIQGIPDAGGADSYIAPAVVTFKSPGPIDQNYAGPWDLAIINQFGIQYGTSDENSQNVRGYIPASIRSLVYDERRQALYAMVGAQFPDYSQHMRLYFVISRDNGQTWSAPIDIESSSINNRGFQSMALDSVTGNLIFGWYDGRNDPAGLAVQYFGAILPAAQLDQLVNKIPLSNPLYTLPPATGLVG